MAKTQQQLDIILRKAAGKNAIEALICETRNRQIYRLSDGSTLSINKTIGKTVRTQAARTK
jgi:hypothetical protein